MDRAISHYTVHQQLGAGTFGSVHLVTPQGTDGDTLVATGETNHYNHVSTAAMPFFGEGQKMALKRLRVAPSRHGAGQMKKIRSHQSMLSSAKPEMINYFSREVHSLRALNKHTWRVTYLYDTFMTTHFDITKSYGIPVTHLNLIMEVFGSTLTKLIYRGIPAKLTHRHKIAMSRQLLEVVDIMHQLNIVHRDLKPDNILVQKTGDNLLLKLCDFGSSKIMEGDAVSSSYICTRWYRAPELLMGSSSYDTTMDLWSVGVLLAELWLGQPLFAGMSDGEQLALIFSFLGMPTTTELEEMKVSRIAMAVAEFQELYKQSWRGEDQLTDHSADLIPSFLDREGVPPGIIHAIRSLLQYSPHSRHSCSSILLDCSDLYSCV